MLFAAALVLFVVVRPAWADEVDCTLADAPGDGATVLSLRPCDELLVTARRRAERAQDVPLALSVIGGRAFDAAAGQSLARVQQLDPTLHVFGYNARTTSISIRGLGGNVGRQSDGLEGGVGVFVDEVYVGRVGATMFELLDLERLEVLRGPQGTLFGRNTTAGAINLVSRPPNFDMAETVFEASAGNYGFRQLKASISGPLRGDTLAGRSSFADTSRDGFITNVHTGEDVRDFATLAVRGAARESPTPELAIRLIADYARQRQNCCTVVGVGVLTELDSGAAVPNGFLARTERLGYTPLPFMPFERRVDADSPIAADMDQRGLSLHVDWSLEGHELTSITAYRAWDWDPANDGDDTALPVITTFQQLNRQRQVSQELRIASAGSRRVDYLAGFYHFQEVVDALGAFAYGAAAPQWFFSPTSPFSPAVTDPALNGFAAHFTASAETRSDAAFAQGTWHVADAIDLTAGLRFTREHRLGNFDQRHSGGPSLATLTPDAAAAAASIRASFAAETAYAASAKDDSVVGALTASYSAGRRTLSYATVARGHKAGGLNLGEFPADFDPVVQPETVHHYEIGAKSELFGDSLVLNGALYRTKITDYQTAVVQPSATGARPLQYIANIEEAVSRGIELDASWSRSPYLHVSASVAFVDAKYVSFPNGPCPPEVSLTPARCDLTGEPLAGAPEQSWTLGIEGQVPLSSTYDFFWQLDRRWQSDVLTAVSNSRHSLVDAYALVNLRVGLRRSDGRRELVLWARNLLDEDYLQVVSTRSTGWIAGLPGDPRTLGATFRGQF